jgi:hypothetical protein
MPGIMTSTNRHDMGVVYVLSLPAFRWTKTDARTAFRYSNTCQVVGNGKSQMLNIGGIGIGGVSNAFAMKDPFPSGLGIFNLNTLLWQDTYDPNAKAYTPDQSISSLYDSSGKPKMNVAYSDPALESIFQVETKSSPASSSTPTSPPNTAGPTGTSPVALHSTTSKTKYYIIGGVISGIAVISGLALLVFCFLAWKRKKQLSAPVEINSSPSVEGIHSSQPAEMTHNIKHVEFYVPEKSVGAIRLK